MIKKIYDAFLKSNGFSTDTRSINNNTLFFALKGENFNANKFTDEALKKGASYVIIDEKEYQIPNKTFLVDDVLQTLQKLALYHREKLGLPIIALTGSNGKTTTKELINTVLSEKFNTTATKGNLNNHIGVPLTLLSMNKETEIGIVEMGANHPKEIEFLCNIIKPNYGYITNFGKAHLEGFGSIEGVIKAKSELYEYLKNNNKIAFINNNDKIQVKKTKDLKIISFGNRTADYPINFIEANPFVELEFDKSIIKSHLIGIYNFNNISVAIAIGKEFKVSDKLIKKAIENYTPTNNRSQIIIKDNTKIILDAYNANPSSMKVALENFIQLTDNNKIVIIGDMFELGKHAEKEHQNIAELTNKGSFKKVYLLGENFLKTTVKENIVLKDFSEFKKQFNKIDFKDTTILIKASRGMALERIVKLFD